MEEKAKRTYDEIAQTVVYNVFAGKAVVEDMGMKVGRSKVWTVRVVSIALLKGKLAFTCDIY